MTTTPAHRQQADHLIAAVNDALAAPTSYRDDTPLPRYGTAPPVPQPGRPPMSQKATDASALMLTGSVLTLATGGAASAVLWASGHADPTVIGLIAAAPLAIAAPIWALARLVKAATKTTTEHHHHYSGPVRQQTVNSHSRWMGKTTNNL
ncbi:hypothetical protein ACGF3K_14485 [Streptomyces sp. NPDC047980]|uniref:hypothetical protein n=1 Tax=Streptomyces sp. NPDC047980 TaxID=3365494 RepID=UPI003717DB9E